MNDRQIFGTDLSSRIFLAVPFGLIFAMSVVASFDDPFFGLFAVAAAGGWLYFASHQVFVTSDHVEVKRFGIAIFSAPRSKVQASIGRGGEMRTHLALVLKAPGQKRVELLRTMFGAKPLSELSRLLGGPHPIPEGIF